MGVDAGGDRRLVLRQLVIVRQILAIGPEHPENRRGGGNNTQKQEADQNRDGTDEAREKRLLPQL